MRSIADDLRIELRRASAGRSCDERLRDALALGRRDARLLAAARGITEDEAARALARQRQHGRRRSGCHEALLT
jgi:hypothetical protein